MADDKAWHQLAKLAARHMGTGQRRLPSEWKTRAAVVEHDGIEVDISRQYLDEETLDGLEKLAIDRRIEAWRDAMIEGSVVNASEQRQVLHIAQRDPETALAKETLAAMAAVCTSMLASGVEDIVCIGIGGSNLGPAMVVEALRPWHQGPMVHFVSNVDFTHLADTLEMLIPATTGFVIISKAFSTVETRRNAETARDWLVAGGVRPADAIYAVTSNPEAAVSFGIARDAVLTMHDAVGGRFSLWSAVGIGIMAAIGEDGFNALLAGAHSMDGHFTDAPLMRNMPILLGMLRVWNRSFLGISGQAVIPYDQRLNQLPAWLQQLEMESNGKQLDHAGRACGWKTAGVVFGAAGSNAQHSFFQQFHQGSEPVAIDFLAGLAPPEASLMLAGGEDQLLASRRDHHRLLLTSMLAQADTLADGAQGRGFPGGRPSSLITWQQTTPYSLGQLLALYEHVTVVSGWLWQINSFDQPGVELGKSLAQDYINLLDRSRTEAGLQDQRLSASSRRLLQRVANTTGKQN